MKYEKQPCAAILAGAGHKQPVLALVSGPNKIMPADLY